MAIVISYSVDTDLYNPSELGSSTLISTTEYMYNNETIIHVLLGEKARSHLSNRLSNEIGNNRTLQTEQFFIKKNVMQSKAMPSTRSSFEKRMRAFDMNRTAVSQEIVEELNYCDKNQHSETVSVVILIKNERAIATIDFKDSKQFANFIRPDWLLDFEQENERTLDYA